jgi:CheY-like chemotaxis protein
MDNFNNNSTTILVVEDQSQVAFLIGAVLDKAGYSHNHVANGQEAIKLLKDGLKADLILLDIVMPVMDGYEVLDALKADETFKDIPVVMLSGLEDATDVMKAVKKGALDYCTKPIDPDDLLSTLARFIKQPA